MRKTTTPQRSLRYASYCRCSSDDQAEGDFSTIQVQQELNRDYIQKAGGTLVAELTDEGKTGTNLERAGWRKLLALAQKREIDAVVVTYMSRLARGDAYNAAEYLLREKRVTVETVEESFTDDLAGRMQKRTKNFVDGIYADQVSQWTRTKQAKMVAAGYHTGGIRPFGYLIVPVPGMVATPLAGGKVKPPPKLLVPHPDEAPWVKRCFELFLATSSIAEVQRYLRSVDTTRRWQMTLVRNLLASDKYRGVARFGEHVNPSAHEALVSEQLFDAVQVLLAAPEEQIAPTALGHHNTDKKAPCTYYLRGIIHCQSCGGRMTPTSATGKTGKVGYYECVQGAKGNSECPVKRVNAEALHEAVLTEIVRCSMHPSRISRLYEESVRHLPQPTEAKEELAKLRRNLRETQKKAGRVVEAIKQVGALPALAEEVRQLEELAANQQARIIELETLQSRRTISRPDAAMLAEVWKDLLDYWEEISEEERSLLLRLVIQRIEMVQKEKGAVWLSLAAHQITAPPGPLLTQEDDAEFSKRDRNSAAVIPLQNYRTSKNSSLISVLSIPSYYRRRGNNNHGLVTRVRFALASNQSGKLALH